MTNKQKSQQSFSFHKYIAEADPDEMCMDTSETTEKPKNLT
jgi:hypothetical protein